VKEDKFWSVTVVHLVWLPSGIDVFKEFIESYKQYHGGYEHNLVLLFNGVKAVEELVQYREFAQMKNVVYKSFHQKKGWDLEVYRWVASQIESKYVLFLNSYSRFLNDNWLAHFMNAAAHPNVGIVGATGTYHSIYSMIRYETRKNNQSRISFKDKFRRYKLIIKNIFLYRFWFAPFPNPHIRTNGFLIERELFLNLTFISIKKKYDAYRMESGRNGFTQQIIKKGLKPLVVDKNGEIYEIEKWKKSCTFWIGSQVNLLISDNQTRKYLEADHQQKKFFTFMAWGC